VQAVILAGGEGHRLRPLTRSRPKVLLPVANRPIIDYTIESLQQNGIRDIIVVAGYRKEQVVRYLNELDSNIEVVIQNKQLGTGDALKCADGLVSDDFLLLPGDNYIGPSAVKEIKDKKNAVLVSWHPQPFNFGIVELKGKYVCGMHEKPDNINDLPVSTGVFSLSADIFSRLDSSGEIPDFISDMINEGIRIEAIHTKDWLDSVYPWDLLSMNNQLIKKISPENAGSISRNAIISGPVLIGEGTEIGPNTVIKGPVVIGDDCVIGSSTCIMPGTSIGSRVRIDPFVYLEESLLMNDVSVGSHSRITDSVIGEGSRLADHTVTTKGEYDYECGKYFGKTSFGAVLGDGVSSAPFTVFSAAVVGNSVSIEEGRFIKGDLPDNTVVK
jgi:NDP-sugar pyrophosphorylase family protein